MDMLIGLIVENRMYIGLILIVIIGILFVTSESLRRQLKKGLVGLLVLAALGGGYYFITGKTPESIPGDINAFFNESPVQRERDHTYYKDPVERYGDQVK